ncbi:TerD family protein [Deinococcus radiophilus]|uniref:TerD family protein n=1 Tax=Deinococcus radiophilus TaxID=32062 RepID=UPI0036129DEC
MTQLQAGQRLPLSDLGLGHSLTVTVECDLSGTDITAFGLNDGQLSDDRYMVFYNQPQSPEGALRLAAPGTFSLNLDDLPASVTEVYLTATHDSQPVSRAGTLRVTVDGQVNFDAKPHLKDEKAVMLVRFYRHGGLATRDSGPGIQRRPGGAGPAFWRRGGRGGQRPGGPGPHFSAHAHPGPGPGRQPGQGAPEGLAGQG